MTLAEADQFETLEQQGVISGFENTTTGIAISISPGAWGGIADLCLLQPEICVAGGVLFTAYVVYRNWPAFVEAAEHIYAMGKIQSNEWTDWARQAVQEGLYKTVCQALQEKLQEETSARERAVIVQALKFCNCKNTRKVRRGAYP